MLSAAAFRSESRRSSPSARAVAEHGDLIDSQMAGRGDWTLKEEEDAQPVLSLLLLVDQA